MILLFNELQGWQREYALQQIVMKNARQSFIPVYEYAAVVFAIEKAPLKHRYNPDENFTFELKGEDLIVQIKKRETYR